MGNLITLKKGLAISLVIVGMIAMFLLGAYVQDKRIAKENYIISDEMSNLSQTLTYQAGEIMLLEEEINELEVELENTKEKE